MALIKLVINTINIRNITMRTLLIIVSVWMQYYYGLHVLQKYVFLHTMACAFKTAVHERCSWGLINWNEKRKKKLSILIIMSIYLLQLGSLQSLHAINMVETQLLCGYVRARAWVCLGVCYLQGTEEAMWRSS